MGYDYSGQTILVTGGTRGIGAAISRSFLQAGARVIAVYAGNEERAAAFRAEQGEAAERLELVRLDVADRAIGVDQVIDAGLLDHVLGDALGRGRRGRAGRRLAVGAEAEALEEGAPGRVDRLGIVEPALVILLDEVGVGALGDLHRIEGGEGGHDGRIKVARNGHVHKRGLAAQTDSGLAVGFELVIIRRVSLITSA